MAQHFLPFPSFVMLWYRLSVLISFISLVAKCMGAATTTAVCTAAEWTFNQLNMSPCLVAANLEAVCNGGDWNIPGLPQGSDYSGPTSRQATECTCNTVTYSLVAACSVCQSREFTTWSDWRQNCSDHDVSIAIYPLTLPAVAVPAWAYLNVTTSNTFDPNAALSVHNAGVPDVGSGNTTAPPPTVSTVSHSNKHLGAIIGGAVGGAVFVILISSIVYCCIRRQTRMDRNNTEKARMDMAASPAPFDMAFPTILAPPLPPEMKLYDPTDPSTFPTSPAPTLPTYRSSEMPNSVYSPGDDVIPPLPYVGNLGQYTGVPEV